MIKETENKQKLVLGVGSQYAGTLLLHNILDKCTNVAMHPMTELHYFDTLYGIRDKKILKAYAKRQYDYEHDKFLHEYDQTFFNKRHETLLHASHLLVTHDVENIDYFELFSPMSESGRMMGEISPEYMLIPDEDLEKMSRYLGRDCKIVLMVRHPVDRFLESLKLHIPKSLMNKNRRIVEKDILESIEATPAWFKLQETFNHYEEALKRYRTHFDHVLSISYESLLSHTEENLSVLQHFLGISLDKKKALDLCTTFLKNVSLPMEISTPFRNLLEYKFRDDIAYLHDSFKEVYPVAKSIDAATIDMLSHNVLKKDTLIETPIKGLDRDTFFLLNADLKKMFSEEELKEQTLCLPQEIMKDLYLGKRTFHPDYVPFNEALYKKTYPDIRKMIKEEGSSIDYGFDHFCIQGYQEIITGKRKWYLSKSEDDANEENGIEKIPLEYYELSVGNLHQDSFYVYQFVKALDNVKFLLHNADVKEAIENNVFESVYDYLIYNGLKEIDEGTRFPYGDMPLQQSILGSVDRAIVIDDHEIFLSGWLFAGEKRKISKVYLSNGWEGINIVDQISNFDRADLESMMGDSYRTAGFYVHVKSHIFDPNASEAYALIIVTDDGLSLRLPLMPEEITDPKVLSRVLLDPLRIDSHLYENLDQNIGPALQSVVMNNPYVIEEKNVTVLAFGDVPEKPDVSIIVPLYGRIDFVEFQLSQFANDPYFKKHTELIYVLDDPSLSDDLLRLTQGLYPLFEIPFKVVTYTENYGYAIANNIGARYATAEKILLLNSDIMPLEKEWLPNMITAYKELKDVGALGPKLLFEDGAVQHAGMAFEKSEMFGMWLNEHPGKGLPDMCKEEKVREVPAVTAACLLLDRSLYEEVGGLSENYLLGDFEDSDLCLKLIEKGKKNYYLPTVSLCHLERQSQNLFSDTSWKTKITLFNGWQHHIKWNDLITTLMEKNK